MFFCLQLRGLLQLMGFPVPPRGVGGQFGFTTPCLPPVSPEGKKRGSTHRTSSWVRVHASSGRSPPPAGVLSQTCHPPAFREITGPGSRPRPHSATATLPGVPPGPRTRRMGFCRSNSDLLFALGQDVLSELCILNKADPTQQFKTEATCAK